MRQDRIILLLVAVVAILSIFLLTGVGYAVETDNIIKVSDNPVLLAEQSDFKIEFIGEPTYSGTGTATLKITGPTTATMNITELNKVGDSVTAIVTIGNKSNDIYADINAEVTNTNTEYFKVTSTLSNTKVESEIGETNLKITVELIKLPIYNDEKTTIYTNIFAKPCI